MTEKTVFTGMGVLAPTGLDAEAHWQSVLAGKSGLDRISRFDVAGYPVRVAGEIDGFAVEDHLAGRLSVQTDHWTHLALVGTDAALADAGVDPAEFESFDMGVITSSSSGGTEFGQREIQSLWGRGAKYVTVYQSIAWFYAATTGQVSIRNGMRGPCGVLVAEQAGGLDALAQARRALRESTRLVVTGGTDASLCPYGLVAQISAGRLSTVDDPARAYLPFDVEASGFVPGEGGAILIAEQQSSAKARGAKKSYGELLGHASTFDPPPGSARPPALRRAIELALADAGKRPDEVDLVFADASGCPASDLEESTALAEVFGPAGVPVTAPKTLTGRLYGGGAPLDVATALLALREGVIPPTFGVEQVDPVHRIDLVTQAREARLRTVLVLARGYGGFNSALVLGAPA